MLGYMRTGDVGEIAESVSAEDVRIAIACHVHFVKLKQLKT
jgi:hypothetical protein